MGRSRYKIREEDFPYFLTMSVVDGLPVFSLPGAANFVLDSLNFLQEKRNVALYAYVIMENHLHLIAKGNDLGPKIGLFKSYTARRIIDHLDQIHYKQYLKYLRRSKKPYKNRQSYQVWEDGFYPKQIIGHSMMSQKITYIHNNPVKRGYVDLPEHWRYTSARNYTYGTGLIPITKIAAI